MHSRMCLQAVEKGERVWKGVHQGWCVVIVAREDRYQNWNDCNLEAASSSLGE